MVNTGHDGHQAVTLRCRSWSCPLCHDYRRKQLVALGRSGKPDTFITLTVNPAHGSSPYDRARQLADAWRTVVRLLKRRCRACKAAHKAASATTATRVPFQGRTLPDGLRCCYGYQDLPYLCVFEATKNGEPHLHILARVPWIGQKWLSKKMARLMLAPVVDIRRVRDAKKVAYYISKYCGKQPQRFKTCKRYWSTRDWELEKFEPEPPPGRWHNQWHLERVPLSELAEDWRLMGYEVQEGRHRVLAYKQGPSDEAYAEFDAICSGRRRVKPC